MTTPAPEGGFSCGQLLTDITDFISKLGLFDSVQAFELDGNIGNFVAAVWPESIEPVAGLSGLDVTSLRVEFTVRIYTAVSQQAPGSIEPRMVDAATTIMKAFNGSFTVGETVYGIDLLGEKGPPLQAKAGWQKVGSTEGSALYRIMDVMVPFLLADVWPQDR